MFLTTQHDATVVVFRKDADQDDAPLRLLQGDDTGLGDPHGIAIDPKKDVFYVANYGSHALRRADQRDPHRRARVGQGTRQGQLAARPRVRGAGQRHARRAVDHDPRADGEGERQPLRMIKGPKTQLNWPTGLAFDAGAPRAVRRQRHGPVDPGVRRRRASATPRRSAC